MTVKLLTGHHLEFLTLKGGCICSSESTLCQNTTLLEITCHGSNVHLYFININYSRLVGSLGAR